MSKNPVHGRKLARILTSSTVVQLDSLTARSSCSRRLVPFELVKSVNEEADLVADVLYLI